MLLDAAGRRIVRARRIGFVLTGPLFVEAPKDEHAGADAVGTDRTTPEEFEVEQGSK